MAQPTWAGRTLGNRYQLESLLGRGGMSAVYKATDPNLRRTVAIKLIHPHLADNEEFVRRFEEEAAAVANLRHPNIIQVFDFNNDAGTYYMVLEYVEGITLESRLKQLKAAGQRMSITEVQEIMDKLCSAVHYAHQEGMVHRDLKPANVMIRPDGEPLLMDFGIVKMMGGNNNTATGALMGTVSYMSPEQIQGRPTDHRTDIYALGVMLYEMIAGVRPYAGDTSASTMMMHLTEPVPDLREHVLPSDLDTNVDMLAEVIQQTMSKEPADRYQTAVELSQAIHIYADHDATVVDASQLTVLASANDTILAPSAQTAFNQTADTNVAARSTSSTTDPNGRSFPLWAPILIILALIVGGGYWFFSRNEEPEQILITQVDEATNTPELQIVATSSPTATETPTSLPETVTEPTVDTVTLDPNADDDGDGLTNSQELEIGTDPTKNDSDDDGILDTAENAVPCLDPLNADTDNDGISDNADPDPCGVEATPTPTLGVTITSIELENNLYMVSFMTLGYEPAPGAPHVHFFFNTIPPEESGIPGAGPWQIHTNPGEFAAWGPLDRPVGATQLCAIVGNSDHTTQLGTEHCFDLPEDTADAPALTVQITNITEANNLYEVTFTTNGYDPLPGDSHIHFFFENVATENAGIPGSGPWQIHTSPEPFRGLGPNDRPNNVTRLCALVANPDHTVIEETGNCFNLPDMELEYNSENS